MKKFISKTIIFFGVLISIVLFFTTFLDKKIEHTIENRIISLKYLWIDSLENNPTFALMGSSTVKYGLSASLLAEKLNIKQGKFINFGNDAKTPVDNYFLYKKNEKYFNKVRKVIYGLDTWIFSKKYYKYHKEVFFYDWSFKEIVYSIYEKYTTFSQFLNFYKNYNNKKNNIVFFKNIPKDYGSVKLKKKAKNFSGEVSKSYDFNIYSFSELQFQYLKKLRDELEKKEVEVVFLLPPKSTKWYVDYELNCKNIDDEFIRLFNKYMGDVKITGSYKTVPDEFQLKMFADDVHLNQYGQEYYTKKFKDLFLSISNIKKEKLKNTFSY